MMALPRRSVWPGWGKASPSSPLVVAFSGGKDSTAMALRLAEKGEKFRLLHTATGNELPEVRRHMERVSTATGASLIDLDAPTLGELIEEQQCLPNWQMRWCTRIIKIETMARWLSENRGCTLAVGLRADEEGRAGGTYSEEDVNLSYPLREWGWNIGDVVGYCEQRGYVPPERTDCAVCPLQTLYEWWSLWKNHPGEYAQGEAWEKKIQHTFRSPSRDTRPAAMKDLRVEFEKGYLPKRTRRKATCRVCSM